MKTLALLPLLFALLCSVASAADLKTEVAAWFGAENKVGATFEDKSVPNSFTLAQVADGKVHPVLWKYVRDTPAHWTKFTSGWSQGLIDAAKSAKDTPVDRTLLSDMRRVHDAIQEASTDRAKADEAVRRMADLKRRVM